MSIKKNILLNTAYQILTIITPFITSPYLARVLGADRIGINSYAHSLVSYFTMFAALGTYSYGVREISRTRDDKDLNTKIFWEIELLTVFTTAIMIFGWVIFLFFVNENKILYIILTLNLLSTLFNINWFYVGIEQFKYTVTRNTIVKIIGIVLILTLVKSPKDLWLFVTINSVSGLLGNISMWFGLKKFLVKIPFKSINIWPHFKETLVYFIPTIATSIYHVLDKTLIGIITKDSFQNGYYEEANKIVSLIKSLSYSSVTAVLGARNSYLYGEKKYDEIKIKINKAIDVIFFMTIGACFGLIGVAKNFIPFFLGNKFEPTILLLQLLSPTLIIIGISVTMNNLYYIPAGLKKISCFFEITGAAVNLTLNLVLIPRLQSNGAVIGTLIAESVIALLYIIFSKGFLTFKTLFYLSWKKIIAAILMLFSLYLINLIPIPKAYILFMQIFIGALIYTGSLLLLRDKFLIENGKLLLKKFLK